MASKANPKPRPKSKPRSARKRAADDAERRPRRPRPLRMEDDTKLWFVTSRVVEERFFTHPILTCGLQPASRKARGRVKAFRKYADDRLLECVEEANSRRGERQPELTLPDARKISRGLVGSAIARAQELYDARVFAVVVMSNHIHLVVQTQGKNLARFMRYVKSTITREVNLLTGRRGSLWGRRYDAQPILDDESVAERIGYTVNNPRAANLVEGAEHWPGLVLAPGLDHDEELSFEYLDRSAWHKAGRPRKLKPFYKSSTLRLSRTPSCEGLGHKALRESLEAWVEHSHAKTQAKRAQDARDRDKHHRAAERAGQCPPEYVERTPSRRLGLRKVIHARFDKRPRHSDLSKRPYEFTVCPIRRQAHKNTCFEVMDAHFDASKRFREGERDVEFPVGTYPPPIMHAA